MNPIIMRGALLCALVLLLARAPDPSSAQGIQGPPGENRFCAHYDDGTESDCTFATFAQCQAAIAGSQGFCDNNVRLPGRYLPDRGPHLFPQDPLGLYRNRSQDLPPVPPPPGE